MAETMNRQLKFLLVSNFDPDPNSGTPGTILSLGKALESLGHQVGYSWRPKEPAFFSNPRVHQILELPHRQLKQVEESLKRNPCDVVIVSQIYAYKIYEKLASRYPETLFLNKTHGWEDRVNRQKKLWDKRPFSLFRYLAKILTHWTCVRALNSCQGLITSTEKGRRFLLENYRVCESKILASPYGLDKDYLTQGLLERRKDSKPQRMLYVGNYIPIKGSHVLEKYLPEIGKRFPESSITFVVPPADHDKIRRSYEPSFGKRLNVLCWKSRGELLETYLEHDLLLFPSMFEGFGKVVLEAMACGLSIVGFDEGCMHDLGSTGEGIFYSPSTDMPGFKANLERCLNDTELVRKSGRIASGRVANFTWENTARKITDFCIRRIDEKVRKR